MKIIDGFTCYCGKYYKYPPYIYSHYDMEIVFTCPSCGRKYNILRGVSALKESAL